MSQMLRSIVVPLVGLTYTQFEVSAKGITLTMQNQMDDMEHNEEEIKKKEERDADEEDSPIKYLMNKIAMARQHIRGWCEIKEYEIAGDLNEKIEKWEEEIKEKKNEEGGSEADTSAENGIFNEMKKEIEAAKEENPPDEEKEKSGDGDEDEEDWDAKIERWQKVLEVGRVHHAQWMDKRETEEAEDVVGKVEEWESSLRQCQEKKRAQDNA